MGISEVSNQTAYPAAEREQAARLNALSAKDTEGESIIEMMKQAREKAEQRRDMFKPRGSTLNYGDAAMTAYSKLSGARTPAQAGAAAGYAQRQIARFQAALRSDSENSEQIKAAIRQLQKAAGRARRKKNELEQDNVLRARQKRAAEEKRRRRASGLGHELGRRRAARAVREAGYFRETEIENRLQSQLAQTRTELREQARQLGEQLTGSAEAAAREYAAQAAPDAGAAAGGAGVDVQA